ncbi:hypothetical protein MRB53_033211 [Persea americana]|uniref:Uncharacterized protein n=1 Tax=Persea americana TaxID=3435 RepID=A0ACC2KV00_PERAE|nr:hypothetical protein MRB53_033211 [Persea americana]
MFEIVKYTSSQENAKHQESLIAEMLWKEHQDRACVWKRLMCRIAVGLGIGRWRRMLKCLGVKDVGLAKIAVGYGGLAKIAVGSEVVFGDFGSGD